MLPAPRPLPQNSFLVGCNTVIHIQVNKLTSNDLIDISSFCITYRVRRQQAIYLGFVSSYFKFDGEVNVFLFNCCLSRGLREPKIKRFKTYI